jgi:YD repeat-containing protein
VPEHLDAHLIVDNYATHKQNGETGSGSLFEERQERWQEQVGFTYGEKPSPKNGNATAMAYVCGSAANAPTGARQSRVTYCEQAGVDAGTCPQLGLVLSVNGPRTDVADVTSFPYYASDEANCATAPSSCAYRQGDLWKVTNALGQVSEFLRYDGAGRVRSAKDANGVVTDIEYNARGWLTASKQRGADNGSEADDAITRLEYAASGQVVRITQPDGAVLDFTYDAARRLTDITDALGHRVHYALDWAGNRTVEENAMPAIRCAAASPGCTTTSASCRRSPMPTARTAASATTPATTSRQHRCAEPTERQRLRRARPADAGDRQHHRRAARRALRARGGRAQTAAGQGALPAGARTHPARAHRRLHRAGYQPL